MKNHKIEFIEFRNDWKGETTNIEQPEKRVFLTISFKKGIEKPK